MEGADESTELRRHPKDFLVRQMLDARSLDAKTKSNETQTFERRMREREREREIKGAWEGKGPKTQAKHGENCPPWHRLLSVRLFICVFSSV